MTTVEPLPEGCVLNEHYEIRQHLRELPAGRLYLALGTAGERPRRLLLLARPPGAPPDRRVPSRRLQGLVPGLAAVFQARGQEFLVLDCQPGEPLTELAPFRDDETALLVLAALSGGLAELAAWEASTLWYTAAHLAVQPGGELSYLGPIVSRGEDRPELALARLAGELLAGDEPWSVELSELLAALGRGETAPLLATPAISSVVTTSGTANDAGPFRAGNEDSALQVRYQLTAEPGGEELELVAVADGVGGHRAGAMASRLALSTFASSLLMSQAVALLDLAPLGEAGNRAVSECLRRAFLAADETVSALGTEDEETPPGTTLVVALRLGRRLFIGNVGDSRAYLLRGEQLQRLTRDDSVVQRLIEQGELSVEESYGHPLSYAVTQCLGRGPSNLKPALSVRLLNDWDRLVLCTDGVTEVLRDAELAALLRQHDEPQAAAEALVAAARTMGGRDNMTALVMNVRMS